MNYEILNYISLDNDLIDKLMSLDKRTCVKVVRYGKRLAGGSTWGINGKDPIIKLAGALKAGEITLSEYRRRGIGEEIFRATADDIRIWCANCGNVGLENIGWIKNHLSFKLFRIGRLQYQFFTAVNPAIKYNKLPFGRGEKLIYIHIPQGEKLTYEDCISSLAMAGEFFGKYFPEYKYSYYFCESWLLYEGNLKFMSGSSNIVKFMSLFDIRYSYNDGSQAMERIFNIEKSFLSGEKMPEIMRALPEDSSLQRRAKQYLLEGNSLGIGVGIIEKSKYTSEVKR